LGQLDLRTITNIATGAVEPNLVLGKELRSSPVRQSDAPPAAKSWARSLKRAFGRVDLPADFDDAEYYRINPDVERAGRDAAEHYLQHGKREGRRYRVS
jgi:hypothetical protein